VVNPDMVRYRIESGIFYGLSAALHREITIHPRGQDPQGGIGESGTSFFHLQRYSRRLKRPGCTPARPWPA